MEMLTIIVLKKVFFLIVFVISEWRMGGGGEDWDYDDLGA